jgi:hypothetical protein
LLGLWVAGAGCLLGCSNNAVAAGAPTQTQALVAEGYACSSQTHNCCKKSKSTAKTHKVHASEAATGGLFSQTPSSETGTCPLVVNGTALGTKVSKQELTLAALPPVVLSFSNYSANPQVAQSSQLRLPNRGHTYLRCCVFLI